MKKYSFMLGVVAVIAAGWLFVSPLFIDTTVNEDFDFMLDSGAVDMDKIKAMPAIRRLQMKEQIMQAAAKTPDQIMQDTMPAGAPRALSRGQFVDADTIHKGSGQATMYELTDRSHVIRFEDFRTTNGPALVVYLAKHKSPQKAADVTAHGFLKLGKLKGNVGNQNYVVPTGTDIFAYHSVVIWCELFGVLFSPATLDPV